MNNAEAAMLINLGSATVGTGKDSASWRVINHCRPPEWLTTVGTPQVVEESVGSQTPLAHRKQTSENKLDMECRRVRELAVGEKWTAPVWR